MSELKEVITSYHNLSFSDRIVFYTTVSNDISPTEDMQIFLTETRFGGGDHCIYCEGRHVVKNGKRKDGTQRYLCRDCHRSFIPSSDSIVSRTRKSLSVWAKYLRCMMEEKTLEKDLRNYLSWHVLMDSSHRKFEEFFAQLWGQLLCARITRYGHEIPNRPFLPDTSYAV
ncbi:MAG: hypothetical protein K6B28_07085 [Lachnospiraceae bacterium]|nr:hypothetical protein [Lachnospiraceae bacterium]